MKKSASKVKIGLIQMKSRASQDETIQYAMRRVREAAHRGAQIICLQELFRFPYFPQTKNKKYFSLSEPIPGPTTELMSGLAASLGVFFILPLF